MRRLSLLFAGPLALILSGCGYVHFGRMPDRVPALGDAKSAEAISNLSTENKILRQELALARREGDTLRLALEKARAGPSSAAPSDLVAKLNETTNELATLRASYARLQATRADGGTQTPSESSTRLRELEEQLAASSRDSTRLQQENAQLRADLDRARLENSGLAERLTTATQRFSQAEGEIALLNTELLALKQARTRAEQASEALRAQLNTVLAQGGSGASTSNLQLARATTAGATPTAELRVTAERIAKQAADAASARAGSEPPLSSKPVRKHRVQPGDTLEKLAARYYGSTDRWRTLYEANLATLGEGQPLQPGMDLVVPEN
jgi:DNA repair exonuclease SbcCD ATPase subunit